MVVERSEQICREDSATNFERVYTLLCDCGHFNAYSDAHIPNLS